MNSPNHKYRPDYLHDGTSLHTGRVVITDHEGTILNVVPASEAGEDVRPVEGLLCPGLVNAHCHLELSYLKGVIPRHTGLVEFLLTVIGSRSWPEDQVLDAARQAEEAMYQAGIVAVGDISNTAVTAPVKARGRLYYHTFVEVLGIRDADAASRITQATGIRDAFRALGLTATLAPHAPYSVSGTLLQQLNERTQGEVVSMHNQESPEEDKLFRGDASDFRRLYEALGTDGLSVAVTTPSSLQAWLPAFTHRQPVIAVHNTCTGTDDIRFALASGHPLWWCLCPRANAYIEDQTPPVERLTALGAGIVLGTDSLSSNDSLSVLEEMKLLSASVPTLSLEEMLRWATASGADALGVGDRFGHLVAGTRPGLVQLYPLTEEPGSGPRLAEATGVSRLK